MKIAMVTKHFNFKNGSSRAIHELSIRFISRGHAVEIVCNKQPERYEGPARLRHVPILPLGSWARALSFDRNSRRMAMEGFDIVHGHGNVSIQNVLTVQVCRRANLVARGIAPSRWDVHLFTERRQFSDRGLRRIIVLSKQVRDDLRRHYGISEEKIVVIPNGVDSNRFRPDRRNGDRPRVRRELSISEDVFVLLFVASGNFENRGLGPLLEAFSMLSDGEAQLLVVGGDKMGPYRRRASELKISGRVRFIEFSTALEELHGAADALIFPSYYDTFGNVPFEAMASGLPVIVSSRCGVSDLITDEVNGLVVPDPTDISSMVRAVERVRDPELRRTLGRAARATAEKTSWDAVAERTLAVYEGILAEQ